MEYYESVDYLESLQRRRPKLGTETTAKLLAQLGCPHDDFDCVQIAGSNGKGSTARMLEQILRKAGFNVGLYTSPDLNGLRERIQVNGRKIPKQRVQKFVDEVEDSVEQLRSEHDIPTYFEVLTALAFHHFSAEDIDIAILEVGIGGRYDATSAVDPIASAVTSVTLEHTDILGETIQEIARDKAQIAPPNTPLVTGANGEALETIRSETDVITVGNNNADVVTLEKGLVSQIESAVAITTPNWSLETKLSLLGQHQAINAGIAATLARQIDSIDPDTIACGLRNAYWPGRFEIMSLDPIVILDGAHNPGACTALTSLIDRYEFDNLYLVFGAMKEKDHKRMAVELPWIDTLFLCEPDVSRAEDMDALADAFIEQTATVHRIGSVLEATEQALSIADENDCVLITGSLYTVAEARDRWTRLQIPKQSQTKADSQDVLIDSYIKTSTAEVSIEDIVHRTVKTQLRRPQAEYVEQLFKSIGGSCVLSDTETAGRHTTTLLSGTFSQFQMLINKLANADLGLTHVSNQLGRLIDSNDHPDQQSGDHETTLMGILNVTSDSFYDGGEYNQIPEAVQRAHEMVAAGAEIIDVGGESTRPGADTVTITEEINRVVPVIKQIADLNISISVDTRKAAVADAALEAGADIINDVSGLEDPEMRFIAAEHDASLVIMHSLEAPVNPDQNVAYDDIVEEVLYELSEKVLFAERAGLDRDQIIVDPGFGFGKNHTECFELISRLNEFRALGCPIMVGHSQKSMFEHVDCQPDNRLPPTLAVTTMVAERGADIVRVHDISENAAAIRTVGAVDNW